MFARGFFPASYFNPSYWPAGASAAIGGRGAIVAGWVRALARRHMERALEGQEREEEKARRKILLRDMIEGSRIEAEKAHHKRLAEGAMYTVLLAEV